MTVEDAHSELPDSDVFPSYEDLYENEVDLFTESTMENLNPLSKHSDDVEQGMDGIPDDGSGSHSKSEEKRTPGKKNEENWILEFKSGPLKNGGKKDQLFKPIGNKSLIISTAKVTLMTFFQDIPILENQKAFFEKWKEFFTCESCSSALRGNGQANKTYRLVCKEKACGKSTSFRLALGEVKKSIMSIYPDLAPKERRVQPVRPKSKRGRLQFKALSDEEQGMEETVAEPVVEEVLLPSQDDVEIVQPTLDWEGKYNALLLEKKALKEQNEYLLDLVRSTTAMYREIEARLLDQEARMTKIEKDGGMLMEVVQNPLPKPNGPISFAQVVEKGPKPQDIGKTAEKPAKKLTQEQLGRVFKGLSPNPPRSINAVYAVGISAQKIGKLKTILKEQCQVSLRNVLHIDFIGKSVTEFHVYSDYADKMKSLMIAACPTISFIDVDPLDTALLRNDASEDRVRRAAELYTKRLERRLSTTPSQGHRNFLRQELARAGKVSVPNSMQQ